MLRSYNAVRVLRRNARRSRMERNQIEAELGHLASDVGLDHAELEPAPSRQSEDTRVLAQLRALEVVGYR